MGNSDELLTLVMGCRFNPTRMYPVTRRSEVKAFREEEHDRHIIFVWKNHPEGWLSIVTI